MSGIIHCIELRGRAAARFVVCALRFAIAVVFRMGQELRSGAQQ